MVEGNQPTYKIATVVFLQVAWSSRALDADAAHVCAASAAANRPSPFFENMAVKMANKDEIEGGSDGSAIAITQGSTRCDAIIYTPQIRQIGGWMPGGNRTLNLRRRQEVHPHTR